MTALFVVSEYGTPLVVIVQFSIVQEIFEILLGLRAGSLKSDQEREEKNAKHQRLEP